MAVSEAKKEANNRWNSKAYDQVIFRVKKGKKEEILAFASENNISLNGLMNHLVDEVMQGNPVQSIYNQPVLTEEEQRIVNKVKYAIEKPGLLHSDDWDTIEYDLSEIYPDENINLLSTGEKLKMYYEVKTKPQPSRPSPQRAISYKDFAAEEEKSQDQTKSAKKKLPPKKVFKPVQK